MIQDDYNILKFFRENKNSISIDNYTNMIVEGFAKEILTEPDKVLLNLIFFQNPTQDDLDKCLENWDIEAEGSHKAILMSYFMKMHPQLNYSGYVAPRLKGLLEFYRFQNLKLISHFIKISKELKNAGIDLLIFKGGCMKHLRPEYPRVMGDIDVLVANRDYKKTGQIVENMGYDIHYDIHSMDLHPKGSEEGIMDIHKFIDMESEREKSIIKDIFGRASKQKVFGVETLVPCNEDLFFILLINMVRNLRHKTSYNGILYNLFDSKFLIDSKSEFDWNIIVKNAKKTKTESHIYLAIKFLNNIVPNLLPEKIKTDNYFEKNFKNYCILLIYQRFFLWDMKMRGRDMKIKDLFSSREFFMEYMKLKPKYFLLKLGIIRKNPLLAEMILKKVCSHENRESKNREIKRVQS